MSLKYKITGGVLALAIAFAFGRYTAPMVPNVKTKVNETIDDKKATDKDVHKKIVIVKEKDKTTTTITEDTDTKTNETKDTNIKVDQTVTAPARSTLNVSGLAGIDFVKGQPVYGASVSKELLGPITVGAYGLTNGVVGLSIGINF